LDFWPPRAAPPLLFVTTLIALLVLLRHRTNVARLLAGTEPRIGRRPLP